MVIIAVFTSLSFDSFICIIFGSISFDRFFSSYESHSPAFLHVYQVFIGYWTLCILGHWVPRFCCFHVSKDCWALFWYPFNLLVVQFDPLKTYF